MSFSKEELVQMIMVSVNNTEVLKAQSSQTTQLVNEQADYILEQREEIKRMNEQLENIKATHKNLN